MRLFDMNSLKYFLSVVLVCCSASNEIFAQTDTTRRAYEDHSHFSKAFGHQKYFRLYLPDDYSSRSNRYPVIYYFHGWSERYNKSIAGIDFEMLKPLVNKYQVILVLWDGNIKETDPRPYNVGFHKDVKDEVQMKDYFLELVGHIDSTYRTLADRTHRGVMGFSMGGYMSYVLAGKYPDRICAAVDMTGSSEFFIGYPNNHTLYQLQYNFKNLRDVRLRMHNNDDFISMLNQQVYKSALWEGVPVEYWHFPGDHRVNDPGTTTGFENAMKFLVAAFKHPLPVPHVWSHYDLYPAFDIWGYTVTTNKNEPGFIYLRDVSKNGFGIYTGKWLPQGPHIKELQGTIVTPGIYSPLTDFDILKFRNGKYTEEKLKSDEKGRLRITGDLNGCEFGISEKRDKPNLIMVGYAVEGNQRWVRVGKDNNLSISVLNRGGTANSNKKIDVTLISTDSTVAVLTRSVSMQLNAKERIVSSPSFKVRCSRQPSPRLEPIYARFKVKMTIDVDQFEDEFIAPIFFDVPVFQNVQLDDGKKIKDSVYGVGNGDGVASPGESIMVYVDGKRARLYTGDPYVKFHEEKLIDEVLPGTSGDGYTLTSVIKMADDCADGHVIECLANFETKTNSSVVPIDRKLTWGRVLIKVSK